MQYRIFAGIFWESDKPPLADRTSFFHITPAVTGINWGDEGKGRVIDLLAEPAMWWSDIRAEIMQAILW